MYKNCYVTRGEEYNHYNIHLWDDSGYSVEEYVEKGYIECSESEATHRGLNGEPLKIIDSWSKAQWNEDQTLKKEGTPNMHYSDHNQSNIHNKFLIEKYGISGEVSKTHRELFFDIEIEIGGALTEEYISKAPKPITSIAWWDK